MKYLLDTHIIIWLYRGDKKLPKKVCDMITSGENEIYFSSLAIFEISLKHKYHPDNMPSTGAEIAKYCIDSGFKCLQLSLKQSLMFESLKRKEGKPPHRDPFDNLMLAQAVADDMTFITHDEHIAEYDCENIFKI